MVAQRSAILGENWACGTQDSGVPDVEEPWGAGADLPQRIQGRQPMRYRQHTSWLHTTLVVLAGHRHHLMAFKHTKHVARRGLREVMEDGSSL